MQTNTSMVRLAPAALAPLPPSALALNQQGTTITLADFISQTTNLLTTFVTANVVAVIVVGGVIIAMAAVLLSRLVRAGS